MMSSLRNFSKMLEMGFPAKRVSWILLFSKMKGAAADGALYAERPSYIQVIVDDFLGDLDVKWYVFYP